MSRRAAAFTQADVARLLRAAEQVRPNGGYRVRLSGGELVLEPVEPSAPTIVEPPETPLAYDKDFAL